MSQHDKMVAALKRAREVADSHHANILHTNDLSRADREMLVHHNWLQEIIKGWYMLTRPDIAPSDSTAWYSNFWDFLRIYLRNRYDDKYCLSAAASLDLHINETLAPKQVVVIVESGGNMIELPYGTSIMAYCDPANLPANTDTVKDVRVMPLPLALCRATPTYFRDNQESISIAMQTIKSPAELSRTILENNYLRAAERIIGAYEALNMKKSAQDLVSDLKFAGMKVTPSNPFQDNIAAAKYPGNTSPFVARIGVIWQKHRQTIIDIFPEPPGLPRDSKLCLNSIDEIYKIDAYNSLSIEGYDVSPELIERVQNQNWDPSKHQQDADARNALAAKGYFRAFNSVNESIANILAGAAPGDTVRQDLASWYQQLFSASVDAGFITAADLTGYRRDRVFIRNSRHAPPPKEYLLEAMEQFFDCLIDEPHAAVRAVLGHYIFVYIHPFMDGNGRIARFILNAMLVSGGYPWTVVRMVNRARYIDSLERVHTESDIMRFTQLIVGEMQNMDQLYR